MVELDRSRLIQERWFSLTRWLLIEALLVQAYLTGDISRVLDPPLGGLLLGFTAYTLLVTLLCVFRRTWPIGLAYVTATVDTIVAVLFVSISGDSILNPALVGIVAASVAVGMRRFPIFETFAYSFLIAVGIIVARFYFHQELPLELTDVVLIGSLALLPLLARAATLAPHEGGRDDPVGRLSGRGITSLVALPSESANSAESYHAAVNALASYTDSQFGGVLVRNFDNAFDLYSTIEGRPQVDHLPVQPGEQLPVRLIAVAEPTIWSRRDTLQTRGLPDQYPQRLDSMLVTPLPNVSEYGAVLFTANRKGGGYRPDDRVFAALLSREVARGHLAYTVAVSEIATRSAAMEALMAAIEAKRPGSREGAEECARLATAIAVELGWDATAVEELRVAALLHDVGELAVPDPLLDKTGPLSPDEFEVMRQHPRIAARIIDYFNHSPIVLNAVYGHHERWDGRGYPSGLEGEEIPLEARILCLADSLESMLSPRAFRPALTATDALQEIVKASGTQFDPSVVQAVLAVLQREGPTFLEQRETTPPPQGPDWGRSRVG